MQCTLQVFDLAARLVSDGKGAVLLTAIYVGQELRGVQSDARFLRVYEHGTRSGSDVIAELVYLTSQKPKGVVCTPGGHVTLERRLLAVLPPEADKVNLAEGLWLAVFFLLLGAWVLNTSPTGSTTQRFLVESWDGTVALAEQLGTQTLEQRGIDWACTSSVESDTSAFMRRALTMTRRLLRAGLWVDEAGTAILPQIVARDGQSADFSWLQCFNALIGHKATRKARYALWAMSCSNADCRDQVKSPLCVHGFYAIHRHMVLGLEPCVRSFDHEMYFVPHAVSEAAVAPQSHGVALAATVPVQPVTDADRLLRCAASVSSLALQLPSYASAATADAAALNWMSPQDRRALDAANRVLHRLAMQHELSARSSVSATSFGGARPASRRLQTADEVAHSHEFARGVQAGDPGAVGLLRRQVARLPCQTGVDTAESDACLIARAATEAGERLSTFITQFAGSCGHLRSAAVLDSSFSQHAGGASSQIALPVPLAVQVGANATGSLLADALDAELVNATMSCDASFLTATAAASAHEHWTEAPSARTTDSNRPASLVQDSSADTAGSLRFSASGMRRRRSSRPPGPRPGRSNRDPGSPGDSASGSHYAGNDAPSDSDADNRGSIGLSSQLSMNIGAASKRLRQAPHPGPAPRLVDVSGGSLLAPPASPIPVASITDIGSSLADGSFPARYGSASAAPDLIAITTAAASVSSAPSHTNTALSVASLGAAESAESDTRDHAVGESCTLS